MESTIDQGKPGGFRFGRAAAVVALLLFLVIAGLAAFLAFTDLGRFKEPITQYASELLGRELRIEGELSLRLGADIRLVAKKVTLANAEWSDDTPMLDLGELAITIRAASLVSGPVQIEDLDLRDARILIASDDAGQSNWALGAGEPAPRDETSTLEPPVFVKKLSAHNIGIRIAGPKLEQPIEVLISEFLHEVRGERLISKISGVVNNETLSLDSDLGPRENIWQGKPVDLQTTATLGEVRLSAVADIDNVLSPSRPVVQLELNGPNVEYLLNLLNLPPVTSGPLDVSVALSATSDRLDLAASGVVGEFVANADGWVAEFGPDTTLDVEFSATGPDLARVGRVFQQDRLPSTPFEITGHVAKLDDNLTLDNIRLGIGDAEVTLNGSLDQLVPPSGDALTLRMRGDDIARFRELLQEPGFLTGPFDITVSLVAPTDQAQRFLAEGHIGEIQTSVTVTPSRSADMNGTLFEFDVAGPDSSVLASGAGLDNLPGLPFSVSGRAEYRVTSLRFPTANAKLGPTSAILSGIVGLGAYGDGTDIQVSISTPALLKTLQSIGVDGGPNIAAEAAANIRVADEQVRLSQVDATLGDIDIEGSVSANLRQPADSLRLNLTARSNDLSRSLSEVTTYKPPASPFMLRLDATLNKESLELRDLNVALGDAHIAIDGVVDRPPDMAGTSLRVAADIPNLSALSAPDGQALPDFPLLVSGRFTGAEDRVSGQGVSVTAGDSQLLADFSYRHADVPEIEVSLVSPHLDARPFAGTEEADQVTSEPNGDRVIPDIPIPVDKLGLANVRAEIAIDELVLPARTLRDFRVRGALQEGAIRVDEFSASGRKGQISAELAYVPEGDDYRLETSLLGNDMIFAQPDETDDVILARPRYNINAQLSGHGTSLHTLLSTLDGRVIVEGGKGLVPNAANSMSNLFLGDFLMEVLGTVNPFVKNDNKLHMDCTALMVNFEDGLASGSPALVMQTDRITMVATGNVHLGSEALNINLVTKQRRGLGLSIGGLINPYLGISGTLSDPKLDINEKNVLLEGGTAVATAGWSIVAKGMRDRFFSDKDPCGTALAAYRESIASESVDKD